MPFSFSKTTCEDAESLALALDSARVFDTGRVQTLLREFVQLHPDASATDFATHLGQLGLLTPYQRDAALAGEADTLVVGPYILLEQLGGGSLGTMFRAQHRNSHQKYALRVLPLRSLWKVMQAKQQVATFATLPSHPTIVPIEDIDTANGRHYLAWPYSEGESLLNIVVRKGPLASKLAARVFSQVADGLSVCHRAEIIHGMLRPNMIRLTPAQEPKILDLGLCSIVLENLDDDSMMDTMSTANAALDLMDFAAPEIVADPSQRNPATDIYSLGCVLYFALTGEPPFPDGDVTDKMLAHLKEKPRPVRTLNPDVPQSLAALVEQCLEKLPENRPADMQALSTALLDIADPGTPLPKPQSLGLSELETPTHATAATSPATLEDDSDHDNGRIDFDDIPEEWSGVRHSSLPAVEHMLRHQPEFEVLEKAPLVEVPAPPAEDSDSAMPQVPELSEGPLPPPRTIHIPDGMEVAKVRKKKTKARKQERFQHLPTPVNWGAAKESGISEVGVQRPKVVVPPLPTFGGFVQRRFQRLTKMFVGPSDIVQVSIFGPPEVIPGQSFEVLVYCHLPQAFSSVKTLCRVLRQDADLLGVGYASCPVKRGLEMSLHLGIASAGIAKSQIRFTWIGQTQPRTFEIFVPWESPQGLAAGSLTIYIAKCDQGVVPVHFLVRERQS